MVRKNGPDIRNDNWLFYDDQLLSTLMGTTPGTASSLRIVSPGELAEIVVKSNDIINTALDALAARIRASNPTADSQASYGWLFTAKMVPAGSRMARGTVLHETAFDRSFSEVAFSGAEDFMPSSQEYLKRTTSLGYSARLLLNLGGWNAVRDGGWLQIQPQVTENVPLQYKNTSA